MSLLKKFTFGVVLALVVGVVAPGVAGAATAAELQAQIEALQAQLATLMAQLSGLDGGGSSPAGSCTFSRPLYPGMSGDDVKCLQQYLNSAGHQVAASGVGSPGSETMYYGSLTRAAVKSWQDANGVSYGAYWGYFGPASQAVYNTLGSSGSGDSGDTGDTGGDDVVGEGDLTVTLAGDTPAATTVADNTNANFTKVVFTAGDEAASISKVYVTRTGNTGNSDLENIKFVDMDGVKRGSVGSLNVDNRALITFTPALGLAAGESEAFYVRAGWVDNTTGGKTAALGIASADDVIIVGGDVSGSFPVTGNLMSVVQMTVGSATIAEDGTTIDSAPDVGDEDVVLNQFKITAGSTESITVEQITAEETGTAGLDDVENLELYSVTNGESLGTVSGWNSEGRASWSGLDISIGKGKTHRFEIRADIVDGPSLTVNADVKDGSDWLVSVRGDTYGYYLTPGGSWAGAGSNNQTIASGALAVAKSTSSPATGNIAEADEQALASWDFVATGEEMKISALTLDMDFSGLLFSEVTSVALYDSDDNIVAGPVDCANTAGCAVAFTDTFVVPVGTSVYTAKATISSDASTGDTVDVGFTPGDMTVKGMTSNDTVTPTPATEVEGNTMTIAAGALTATTLTQPEARNVAKGAHDYLWMTGSLDAGTSGEDVNVTAITITDTIAGTGTGGIDDVDGMELWADLTDEDSARGDAYETKVSQTKFPTGTTTGNQAFSLTQTIVIPAGTFVKFAVIGDLATGATTDDTHTVDINAVTATGADTGTTISVTPSGSGQAMTVKASGDLTVTRDASSPPGASIGDIVLGGDTVTLAVFRLTANATEDLDLDSLNFQVTGGNYVDTYYFYSSARSDGGSTSSPIQTAAGGTTAYAAIADGAVTIPASGYVTLTVDAKLNPVKEGYTLDNNGNIIAGFDGSTYIIGSTGKSSGAAANSNDGVAGYTMQAYEARPYFAISSGTPSGNLVPSTLDHLATFEVTASDGEVITFDNADSNQMIVQISSAINDSDGTAGTWYAKDESGTTLSSISVADSSLASGTVTFTFEDAVFTVPAGETKKLYIYGDTSDYEDDGDVVELWLDDAADANFGFSINSGTNYAEGKIILKGDPTAGSFTNPS